MAFGPTVDMSMNVASGEIVSDTTEPEQHLLERGRIGQHRDYDLGVTGRIRGVRGPIGTELHEVPVSSGRPVPDPQPVTGVDEPPGHRRTHRAEPEECDAPHAPSASPANRCISSRSVG